MAGFKKHDPVTAEDLHGYFSHHSADGKVSYVKVKKTSRKVYGFFRHQLKHRTNESMNAKEVALSILSESAEPKDAARHLALRLRAHHKDLRHRAFSADKDDDTDLPAGKGKHHFVYHKHDQDGNDAIQIRNAHKPGHVHYISSSGHLGNMSHEDHPDGVHHEEAYNHLKSRVTD